MISSQEYERAYQLFLRVRTLSGEARDRIVTAECNGDADFRRYMDHLLANSEDESDGSFFVDLSTRALSNVTESLSGGREGARIGDFELKRFLGRGGMGEVWEGTQISLDRPVALKLIRPERLSETSLAYFTREARAGGRINHKGVVSVLSIGEDKDVPHIAMEFVGGGATLGDFLERTRKNESLPEDYFRRIAQFFVVVSDALSAIHEAGIVHRDLKPTNILIDFDDYPKISDFGLARIQTEAAISMTGAVAGTYAYMSPEQLTAKRTNIDARSDLFSLGIVLYEALTLSRPFQGNQREVVDKIYFESPATPAEVRSVVPKDLDLITMKALEKNPDHRYQSAEELCEDLTRYLANKPIQAKSTPARRKIWLWGRRHPGITSSLAIAILSMCVLTGLALKFFGQVQETRRLGAAREAASLVSQVETLFPRRKSKEKEMVEWMRRTEDLCAQESQFEELRESLRTRAASVGPGASDPDAFRWQLDVVEELLSDIEELKELRETVEGRLFVARHIEPATLEDEEEAWDECLLALQEDPTYDGLEMEPILGLVPLGRNERTGLFEFWYWESGTRPENRNTHGDWMVEGNVGLIFVLIPGGDYMMGSPVSEVGRFPVEIQHKVGLGPFLISKYEMTKSQWDEIWGGASKPGTARQDDANLPADFVSWTIADQMLQRSGALRFSTEAEWEYMARAGEEGPWFTGKSITPAQANLKQTSQWRDKYSHAAPVGSFSPNHFGIYDVAGNVLEWCSDWVGTLSDSPAKNPTGSDVGTDKIFRGGCFTNQPHKARSAFRWGTDVNSQLNTQGIRPAVSIRSSTDD